MELSENDFRKLLRPYLLSVGSEIPVPEALYGQLQKYLSLLLRWNERTNLTAVRSPAEIVTRHFGESLFAGKVLGRVLGAGSTVMDLGSGAGFPGIPMQLLFPEWRVTLGESQGKKAAFLREVVRELGLSTEVWAARVESLPADRKFHAVVMRAVDRMELMGGVGWSRLRPGGVLLRMVGGREEGWNSVAIPNTQGVFVETRLAAEDVPRGT